jgi:hypothetical protein
MKSILEFEAKVINFIIINFSKIYHAIVDNDSNNMHYLKMR